MALKKNITVSGSLIFATPFGSIERGSETIDILDCYVKVESVSGTKDQASAAVSFVGSGLTITKVYEFTPSMDGENFIAQAYEHLKTLPEFAGVVDC